jgi:hypothetical protein
VVKTGVQLPVGPPCRVRSWGGPLPHFGGIASHRVSPFPSEPCAVKNNKQQLRCTAEEGHIFCRRNNNNIYT